MGENINWTPEQQAAINHKNGGAIVTAGAGSGKTAVLTSRVIKLICDKENPIDPSKIAVVTFTEKAAAELKSRLSRQMKRAIAENPSDNAFLRSQNVKLKSARISTISSFCFSILRENAEYSRLAPGFTVIDETKATLMKHTVCETILEEFYAKADENEKKLLLDCFVGKNDETLANTIISFYDNMCNLVSPDNWINECSEHRKLKTAQDDIRNRAQMLHNSLNEASFTLEDAMDSLELTPSFIESTEDYISFMQASADELKDSNYCLTGNAKAFKAPRKANCNNKEIHILRENLAKTYESFIESCANLQEFKTMEIACLPAKQLILSLIIKFRERYENEKLALNAADFSDAERGVYEMLINHPDISNKIGLSLIIVDEFQDSNALQYEIFRRLSDNRNNLYFVGDIKQSIYSFRGAQPEVFDRISHDKENYTSLPLNENFRSTRDVIDGINSIFDNIMTPELGGVDYAKESRLVCGTKTECTEENITEVVIVNHSDEMKAAKAEAKYIAQRIRHMIDSGYTVKGRACTQSDFAIILRAPREKTEIYVDALESCNLRANTNIGEPFCERPEIALMIDYLKVIDSPYDDQSLARLLMSPVFGYSAEKMARLRTGTIGFDLQKISEICPEALKAYSEHNRRQPLYACINAAAKGYELSEKYNKELCGLYNEHPQYFGSMKCRECEEFTDTLYRLRSVMNSSCISKLIRCIYDTTETANLLMLADDAEIRNENLDLLISYAKQYEYSQGIGMLSDFLENLSTMEENGSLKSATRENDDGVNYMSIHASKGLQFPIVFVADCGKTFNAQDYSKDVLFSEEYGICLKYKNKEKMCKLPTPIYNHAAKKIKDKMRSEEMRLLYVAATRAEQKLIFTGKAGKSAFDDYYSTQSTYVDCSKQSAMSWILEASKALSKCFREEVYDSFKAGSVLYKSVIISDSEDTITADKAIAEATADSEAVRRISENIRRSYEYCVHTKIAAKYTATQLTANRRIISGSSEQCDLYVAMPDFMSEDEKGLSGKHKGDAYHKLMEHIPFDRSLSLDEIKSYIRNDTSDFLNDKERKCIKPEDIKAFFDCDVSKRCVACGRENIYKEHPIFHKLDVSKLSAKELGLSENEQFDDASPYIQGIADMFFIENGEIVLVDYKSDSFSDEEKLSDNYSFQLNLYKDALETAFGTRVKEMYIYSFRLRKMIPVTN